MTSADPGREVAEPPADASRADVLGAFAWLTLRSARNRLVRQVKRMRSPRYVLAVLFALAYFGFLFFTPGRSEVGPVFGGDGLALLTTTIFALMTAWWWLAGSDRGALVFSPAEVQFLFTAPVTRRQLVEFKLLRAQLLILVNVTLWTVILGRGPEGVMFWLRPLSLWVLFSTLQMHRLGATLVRESVTEHGAAGLRRAGLPMAIAAAAAALLVIGVVRGWPEGEGVQTPFELIAALGQGLRTPPATWALLPFRLLTAPLFAETPAAWARAILPAALLMLLHLVWVIRSDHAFEEAAFEASRQRAARLAERRAGLPGRDARRRLGRRVLPLPPTGDPGVAFLWKNLIAAARDDRFVTQMVILSVAMGALAVGAWLVPERLAEMAALALGVWGGLLVIAGPVWVRYDLRRDLPKLELLRTYPVPGRRVVAAEIASSAIVLAILQGILAVAAFVALLGNPTLPLGLGERVAVLLAVLLALPGIDALSASIHNAAALLFPAWVHLGAERPAGIEAMGQLYLTMFASFLILVVLLVPPALAGVAVAAALVGVLGWWSAVPAVLAGSAVALVELGVISSWLGGIFDRTEPSAVGVTA